MEMHFPFHCFKSTPCPFHFVEVFYFVENLSKNRWNLKPSNLKTIEMKKVHTEQTNTYSGHNRNTRTRREKLTIKSPERRHWPRSDVFILSFTFFARYCTVSTVDFDQVNVC